MPPTSVVLSLVASLFWMPPFGEGATEVQSPLEIEFYDPFDRSTFQFEISEDAYVAVFEVGGGRATLVYPAIGAALRAMRFDDEVTLPEPDNLFEAGRHLLPQRTGRGWSGRSENAFLAKGPHILVVASERPFNFERLNSLYVGEGETLKAHNSFGVVENFTEELIATIVPEYSASDWAAYLHWIRR